jgi:hypothetical protein
MSAAATDSTSFSTSVKAWAAPGRVIVRAAYLESCPFEVQPSAYVHVWGGGRASQRGLVTAARWVLWAVRATIGRFDW